MVQRSAVVGRSTDPTNLQLYKELENINFKEQKAKSLNNKERTIKTISDNFIKPNDKLKSIFDTNAVASTVKNISNGPRTHLELFQKSMKVMLVCGQLIGLNPVIGALELDPLKIRFKYLSVRFIYSFLLFLTQAAMTALCIYRICRSTISITSISFVTFYLSTSMTTFLFLRVANKWPALMKDLVNSSLDKYIDLKVQPQVIFTSVLFLSLAMLEHLLSLNTKYAEVRMSSNDNETTYKHFIDLSFPWYSELDLPFHISTGIFLQFVNFCTTINWSYSDVFIVCMSNYLEAIIRQINKTIVDAEQKYYQPSFWSSLRVDYTRATRLVISFDNAISGIVFLSFATNLFFICLQLFYIFSHGVRGNTIMVSYKGHDVAGIFGGYEPLVYFIFSFAFVLCRFLAVSLKAANIHSASLAIGPSLYNLPSTVYCNEIQRFIEQVHGSTVTLSGLQFFHVTKSLILTVAGTIVTYELVLLQFNGE